MPQKKKIKQRRKGRSKALTLEELKKMKIIDNIPEGHRLNAGKLFWVIFEKEIMETIFPSLESEYKSLENKIMDVENSLDQIEKELMEKLCKDSDGSPYKYPDKENIDNLIEKKLKENDSTDK